MPRTIASRGGSRALEQFRTATATDFVAAEPQIGGDWRPFRVEHGLSGSVRGDIEGSRFSGVITPNLLDSSSVVFLQNDEGKTLRVLIPSKGTAVTMLTDAVKRWRTNGGYRGYHSGGDTHVSHVLYHFSVRAPWNSALSHPETIDMLDASCQKPIEERPIVRVRGELLQNGVALTSAIEIGGEQRTFVPTQFFKSVTAAIRQYVPAAQEPKLLAA